MEQREERNRTLARQAIEARKSSYCPYSQFAVGAALLCEDGTVYQGCNIENAGYTATNCAERTAFFKAVSEGHRRFAAIAVAGGPQGKEPEDFCPPCGVCRQVMAEFCGPEFEIVLTNGREIRSMSFREFLPHPFGPGNLEAGEKGE